MTTTTTKKRERVIGLWLDGTDEQAWIVSDDTWEDGEPSTSTTLRIFGANNYESAYDYALSVARRLRVRVINTADDGRTKCLYDPTTI